MVASRPVRQRLLEVQSPCSARIVIVGATSALHIAAWIVGGDGTEPTYLIDGREVTPVFADLNRYDVTTHFNGESTIGLDGGRATGESYTIAHTSSELTGSARS